MKYTNFNDIPQLTTARYAVDQPIDDMELIIKRFQDEYGLELCPDFQRGHVWDEIRQIKYIEFLLRGGQSSRDLYFNCPGWMKFSKSTGNMVLVDGLQRITAILRFLHNEIPAFETLRKDYVNKRLSWTSQTLRFHVHDFDKRSDVLNWYIELNAGGIAHTPEEIEKVRKLLEKETQ